VSKTQYDIYIAGNIALAKTLIIKSELTASAINRGLSELGISVNTNDPTSWKYYLNLSGQYHSTDKPMTIVSLDTLQTIDFTKENLQIHDSTRREYNNQTHYYQELLSRFPEQESLIQGILTPVDLTHAISATDGTILFHNSSLIEENESNLIPYLQDWINKFNIRWHNKAYSLVDDLYAAAQLGVMFTLLPVIIDNLRVQNCHTRFAHTYHIRSFLASQGRLDVFIDYLTKKQMLWLYRNIRYLHRNAGKRETFLKLIENILTQRGFPIAEWTMRHDLSTLVDDIYPKIEFERSPLNFGFSSSGLDTRDIPNMLDMEVNIAKGNAAVQSEAEVSIRQQMENAKQDRLGTKILESSILDLTDASPFTLSDALLNHWVYFAQLQQYPAIVTVDNPKTGSTFSVGMKDAFIIFLYAYNKARGVTLPNVPILEAWMVRRQPAPSRAELLGLMETRFNSTSYVDKALENLVPVSLRYVSTSMFYDTVAAIHENILRHRFLYATCEHMTQRGQIEQMVLRFYQDYRCDLANSQPYSTWFSERGLDIQTFTYIESDLLAVQLLERCTGADLRKTKTLREVQAAMLRLMSQLSSYSVQYLQSINSFPIRTSDWGAIRIGDDFTVGAGGKQVDILDAQVMSIDDYGKRHLALTHDDTGPLSMTHIAGHAYVESDIGLEWSKSGQINLHEQVEIAISTVLNITHDVPSLQDPNDVDTLNYQPILLTSLAVALNSNTPLSTTLTPAEHTLMQSR
jgi:hypothetical protein